MKYYRKNDGEVYAFEEDGSQDFLITEDMVLMTEQEVFDHLNPPLPPTEPSTQEFQTEGGSKFNLKIADDGAVVTERVEDA